MNFVLLHNGAEVVEKNTKWKVGIGVECIFNYHENVLIGRFDVIIAVDFKWPID